MWVWTDELTDRIGDVDGRELPLVAIYLEEDRDVERRAGELPGDIEGDGIVERAS